MSDNQVIPDAAVEASAKAMALRDHADLVAWKAYMGDARAALEAAAPHLMAEAWDEGRRAWDNYDDDNPYRSAK